MFRILSKRWLKSALNGRRIYWHGERGSNYAAITFDDGPDEDYTPMILDILKSASLGATFFLVGEKIARNINVVKRMINEGHEIGNHTYTHRKLPNLTWEDIKLEIAKTDKLLKEEFNIATNFLRLPKGNWRDFSTVFIALLLKKEIIFWSVDPQDFRAKSSEEVIRNVRRNGVRGGDIILLHDKREQTVNALYQVVNELNDKGLKAVTLSELLAK